MIGFDTGFFVELLRGNPEAIEVWRSLIEGEDDGVISCLSLFELERLGLKGAIGEITVLLESIPLVCKVVWLNSKNLTVAARLSHGLGIPSINSLILAGLLEAQPQTIFTSKSPRILALSGGEYVNTDKHFETYKKKGLTIENIKGGAR